MVVSSAISTKALIDTGAPRCIFPRGVGDIIGLSFPTFPSQAHKKIRLMGEVWPAVTVSVDLLLRPFDDLAWTAEVDFVLGNRDLNLPTGYADLPFAVLGYEGFLDRWAVSFNGYFGYFVVEPAEEFDARQPDSLIADLRNAWPDLVPPEQHGG